MSEINKDKLLTEVKIWSKEDLIQLAYAIGYDWGFKRKFEDDLAGLFREIKELKSQNRYRKELEHENEKLKSKIYVQTNKMNTLKREIIKLNQK